MSFDRVQKSASSTLASRENSAASIERKLKEPSASRVPEISAKLSPMTTAQWLQSDLVMRTMQGFERKEAENSALARSNENASSVQLEALEQPESETEEQVQTKLTVGKPGDPYEQEADSMAAKVMAMPDSAVQESIQRQNPLKKASEPNSPTNSIAPAAQRSATGDLEEIQMKSGMQQGAVLLANKEAWRQPQQEEKPETLQGKEITFAGKEKLLSNKETSLKTTSSQNILINRNKLANFLVEKSKSLLGKGDKGKAEKGNTQTPEKDENKGKPGGKGDGIEVPKALAVSRTVQIDRLQERLIQEAIKTPSRTVINQASVQEPKQATQKLLKEHPNAKYNDKTDLLTLPPLQDAPLEAAGSLKALGSTVAQQTGLTQIIFNRNETGWSLDGKLNPTITGLVTHTGVPASLDPLIQEIKAHEISINPSVEFFMSICLEAAKRHGASVNFQQKFDTSVHPYRRYTEVTFSKATASGTMDTFVTEIISVSDNICPACETDPGVTRPHHVIPASMWRDVIENALTTFGVTPIISDRYIGNIVAAGTSTKGPAVTEDKQCRKCEDNQDKPPGPYSLLQRYAGKLVGKAAAISHPSAKTGTSGGDLFTGLQFKSASSAQIEQFTEDKIDRVVKRIEEVLATVPTGHAVQTSITSNPSQQTAFLNQIRTDALVKAKATPAAYPP